MIKYSIYKGLQKPLVYKGFKGKYIYWGIGSLLAGFVSAGILGAVLNLFAGLIGLIVIGVGGIYYTSIQQKKGLYNRTKTKGDIYILKNQITKTDG